MIPVQTHRIGFKNLEIYSQFYQKIGKWESGDHERKQDAQIIWIRWENAFY